MSEKIWMTSDLHFGHDKNFLYCPRGFSSIEEHDEEIINRWNSVVSNSDIIYIMGDLMLNDNQHGLDCLNRLAGQKFCIFGNHDTPERIKLYQENNINCIGYSHVLKIKKFIFYLSHYPTVTSNYDDQHKPLKCHTLNLFGHTHQTEKFYNNNYFMYHVGLDAHQCYPVEIEQIISEVKKQYTS